VAGYFIGPVYSGTSVYWMRKYEWKKFLEYNKQHQITGFFSVPATEKSHWISILEYNCGIIMNLQCLRASA
jgi:hypothetical protein